MCSIAGIINGNQKDLDLLLSAQSHRAPDEAATFIDNNIAIGMGRLKILDLKSKNLCLYKLEKYILSYNGEIYNYLEIKKELKELGWKFETSSDTEVVLKSYMQWGNKMLQKFNGMFSIAIYNKTNGKIFLARDIAGEKPLYYYRDSKKFIFISEAKALKKILKPIEIKSKFFETFQHCNEKTIWKNVYQLPAAHYMIFDIKTKRIQTIEYWKFKKRKINLSTVNEEFETLMKSSLKLRLRSDVNYGLYYSKGIDSTLLSTLHNFKHKFYFDDSKNYKKDFFNKINKISHLLDFPVGSLSSYPLYKLAERAKKKVKVIISGEGADEIFGGYVRYLPISKIWELNKKFPSYTDLFNKYYDNYLTSFSKITSRNKNFNLVENYYKKYFEMFDDPINAMGFADFKLIMPSLLQMGDRMSAAFGLENRCPFLDKNIIEFGFSLPPEYKIKNFEQKILLRNYLKRKKVLNTLKLEKKGLTIKFNSWFNKNDWNRDHYFNLVYRKWKS